MNALAKVMQIRAKPKSSPRTDPKALSSGLELSSRTSKEYFVCNVDLTCSILMTWEFLRNFECETGLFGESKSPN